MNRGYLIKHPLFALPGSKTLLKSDMEYEVILVDASESPCELPKKVTNKKRIKNRNNKRKRYYFYDIIFGDQREKATMI